MDAALLKPGDRISEYVLDERVGRGGFGDVWRAHHHDWPERVVAVKVPANPALGASRTEPEAPFPVTEEAALTCAARSATAERTLWCPSAQLTAPNAHLPYAAVVRVKVTLYEAERPGFTVSLAGAISLLSRSRSRRAANRSR